MALADRGAVYSWIMILQVLFYAMAFAGGTLRNGQSGWKRMVRNICSIPYVFCLLNFSAFVGFLRFLMKDQNVQWEKARSAAGPRA